MRSRAAADHRKAMQQALDLAKKSPPKPSNFRVGAVLIKLDDDGQDNAGQDNAGQDNAGQDTAVAAQGYTLELPGNTHAEECCLLKLAQQLDTTEEGLAQVVRSPHALYTTMEPCFKRLSGKLPCVERVLRQRSWIKQVYVGAEEPETFVGKNPGRRMLEEGGIPVDHVPGLEKEILEVATAGHVSG